MSKRPKNQVARAPELPYDLLEAANNGDREALARLHDVLDGPDAGPLLEVCGNLARQTADHVFQEFFGTQDGTKACVRKQMELMSEELGWERSGPMERVLIEAVVVSWLWLYTAQIYAAHTKGKSIAFAKYLQHRVDLAHRRHLAAVKMLATVRKLALPVRVDLNVNVDAGNLTVPALRAGYSDRAGLIN